MPDKQVPKRDSNEEEDIEIVWLPISEPGYNFVQNSHHLGEKPQVACSKYVNFEIQEICEIYVQMYGCSEVGGWESTTVTCVSHVQARGAIGWLV